VYFKYKIVVLIISLYPIKLIVNMLKNSDLIKN